MSSIKTVFVGGGSYRWMPKLISDFNRAEALKGSEIALLDIDLAAAREFCAYGEMLAKKLGSGIRHSAGSDEDEAFAGADFIVLTINTGGNEASLLDCEIPRKYGSFQIIGDSAGPGGWIRTWRNAPVFIRMVQKIERLAPNAFVLNYSNPMADLTTILAKASSLRVLGMCHGPLQTRERIAFLFGCAPEAIDMAYAGLNHFHWILRFTVEGREGYAALRRMLNGQTLASCTRRANAIVDDRFENQRLPRFNRKSTMWEDLYEQYGYFCYIAHNHIIEYLPQRLSAIADNPKEAGIDHWWTREFLDSKIAAENARAREYLAGEREFAERSGEIAVNVVEAAVTGKPVMEVVNMVNVGQVDNLPRGFALETNGLIHSSGFTPLALGAIPDVLKGLLEPHIVSQAMLVDACLERDERKAIQALLINPMCASIHPDRVLAMAREGMEAVKRYMPEDS